MIDVPESGIRPRYRPWMQLMESVVAYQWRLFEFHCKAGLNAVEGALGSLSAPCNPGGAGTGEVEGLERRALERALQGLAPPPEVYAAPYRGRIDWSKFPGWARPSDPEMFEGGHEG